MIRHFIHPNSDLQRDSVNVLQEWGLEFMTLVWGDKEAKRGELSVHVYM